MATIPWDEIMNGRSSNQKMFGNQNIRFYLETIPDAEATAAANGVPKYKEIEMIEVQAPAGDRTCIKIDDDIRRAYPNEYNAFKEGQEAPINGTPLSQWALIPRSAVEELKLAHIKTVEQLADLNDAAKRKIGPLSTWCKKAREWLKAADADQTKVAALQEALDKQTKRADRLEEIIIKLEQRLEQVAG